MCRIFAEITLRLASASYHIRSKHPDRAQWIVCRLKNRVMRKVKEQRLFSLGMRHLRDNLIMISNYVEGSFNIFAQQIAASCFQSLPRTEIMDITASTEEQGV